MAETKDIQTGGSIAEDIRVYQGILTVTYTNNGIVDLNGVEIDLGAPKAMSARLTVVTLTGTTPKLDVKLQHRALSTDSWTDVTDGAFTQTAIAVVELLAGAVCTHRFVRVVTNFTDTITVSNYNVVMTANG
jgi:hypothetical protein